MRSEKSVSTEQKRFENEISKLKLAKKQEFSSINTRSNEDVGATDKVKLAKKDIKKLRQLAAYCTLYYITPSVKCDAENKHILTSPKLQKVTFARRTLTKCFRNIDILSQLPRTCERLRVDLHSPAEQAATEWITIRSVCMQHVELEMCLVEAKAGLKVLRFQEEEDKKLTRNMFRRDSRPENLNALEHFLSVYVSEVWEIGEEIKLRVTAGISNIFDLAVSNPSGMVALVESVEVYERAIEKYKEKYGEEQTLAFTEIRTSALAQMYDVFEKRGLDLFKDIHISAAEGLEDEEGKNDSFCAVFNAANRLVADTYVVKQHMSTCFPKNWTVGIVWTCCVAHVCSNQILKQIGGPEGHILPALTISQLLDVVAWVEKFHDVVKETFPDVIAMLSTKKIYLNEKPDLSAGNATQVDYDNAMDTLTWCNNMCWEVHRLAQEEFLERVRAQANEWIANVYRADHTEHSIQEGLLTTSLCEDLFSVVTLQYRTIKEHLSCKSEVLAMAVVVIFTHLRQKQIHSRDHFLQDLESCCAAANDFHRMSEKCEDVIDEMISQCNFSSDCIYFLETVSSELLVLYSADAVYASQSTYKYIFELIQGELGNVFFSLEWEEELTNNEVASSLVNTLDDFMMDLISYLDSSLWKKTVEALVSATVVFYIRCLLLKAEKHTNTRQPVFGNVERALTRMKGDYFLLREYFKGLESRHPLLGRVIDREFYLLSNVQECMEIAAGVSDFDAKDFVPVMNKCISDPYLTQRFFGDVWHIINPTEERRVLATCASMEEQLIAMSLVSTGASDVVKDIPDQPGIKFNECLEELYRISKRKLPAGKKVASLKRGLNNSKQAASTDRQEFKIELFAVSAGKKVASLKRGLNNSKQLVSKHK